MDVGIDIVENARIKLKQTFINHLLSLEELVIYETFDNDERRIEFLAGRWALKEAIYKCLNLQIAKNQIIILNDLNGKPYVKAPTLKSLKVSLSHEKNYTIAIAIDFRKE